MAVDLSGRVALITGAGSGIGAACARALGAAGARVVVTDLDGAAAQAVAEELGSEDAVAQALDVTDAGQVAAAVGLAEERFGALHLAINNAGVPGPTAALHGLDPAAFRQVVDVNLTGVFLCLAEELRALRRHRDGGAIVNMASILGLGGSPEVGAYVAAKHAVVGLTKTAALENARRGIRVNAIAPGFIATPFLDASLQAGMGDALTAATPAGRLGQPEEVAALAVWLLSDAASFLTGGTVPLDGGYGAR